LAYTGRDMRHLLIPLLLFLLSPALASQIVGGHWSERMEFDGAESLNWFGTSMAGIGDVDGDGIRDMAIGAPEARNGFIRDCGAVYVYSGASGTLLWIAYGPEEYTYLGRTVAAVGDINGDGIDDVSSGAYFASPSGLYGAGTAYVYSGLNGAILLQIDGTEENQNLGKAIADAGDIDGDGLPDLILGVPNADPGGVYNAGWTLVCSGADGSVLYRFEGSNRRERMGAYVAGCGDIDGDLVPDILCSIPFFGGELGKAIVYSGATGLMIWEFVGSGQELLGTSLAGGHDVDLDGVPDLLLGAMKAKVGSEFTVGTVYLRSGATGDLLQQWDGYEAGSHFGSSVDFLGDIDGDGVAEILVGAPEETALGVDSAGKVHVYSGASGALLHSFDGPGEFASAGVVVAALGDLNGDGVDEIGYGAPNDSPNGMDRAGSAMVHGFSPILALESATISVSSGETVEVYIDFPESEAGSNYAALVSSTGDSVSIIGGIKVPLTMDAMVQRGLQGRPPSILLNAYGILDGNGDATALYLPAPNLPQLVGRTYWGAVISYDAAAGVASMSSIARALEIVF
jgi:FG-GAP repeat protein